jgi:DNA polymerase III epsilon subunit-like protein
MFNPDIPLVITDIETGGLELHHPIIQIAAIVIVPGTGVILEEFNVKIQFDESHCDPEALRINNYQAIDWQDSIPLIEALNQLKTLYSTYATSSRTSKKGWQYRVALAGGYNSHFDSDRLFHRAREHKIFLPVDPRFLDVMQLALWKLNLKSYKLSDVAEHLGISAEGAHDALVDVKITADVMQKLRVL